MNATLSAFAFPFGRRRPTRLAPNCASHAPCEDTQEDLGPEAFIEAEAAAEAPYIASTCAGASAMRVTGWKRGARAGSVLPGPTSPARYGLYLILILAGYLAGSALRGPYGDGGRGTQRFLISAHVSTTTAAASDGDAGATSVADKLSTLPHLSMASRLLGGELSRGSSGIAGHHGGGSAVARRSALRTGDGSSGSGAAKELYSGGVDGDTAASIIPGDRGSAAEEAAAAAGALGGALLLPPANRTLRFGVCNGYANQRLAVLYGIMLARRLGRSAVLPVLIDNGLQRSDTNVLASGDNQVW